MATEAQLAVHPVREGALEDARWLERCRAGDETAVSVLVARHRQRLVRVAANILRDTYEAEDVAQDAFVRGFRELPHLRDDRAFAGYLYRIVVRLCMDRLRSRRAEPAEFEGVVGDQGAAVENRLLVQKLLDELTPDMRATLVLREMEQLSYEEVAEVLKVPVGTVRSRLHAARERFRQLWLAATRENS